MKKYSIWSARNPRAARMIIAFCHIMLIGLSIVFGMVTYFEDIKISNSFSIVMVIAFSLAYLWYPNRKAKEGLYKYSWRRRIKHDFVMAFSYSCILVAGINQFSFQPVNTPESHYQVRLMSVSPQIASEVISKKESRKDNKMQARSIKAEIKKQLKSMKAEWKANNPNKSFLKIMLILLILGLAILLWSGIASLACSLSCNGQEGLALIVIVVGTLAVVLLMIVAIRATSRIGAPSVQQKEQTENAVERA
jgi:hypothetical protein